jgi:Zn-dependent M28 family amino/carboxypeptidase
MNFDMIGRNNMEHRPQQLKYLYMAKDSIYATWLKEDIAEYSLGLDPDFHPSDDLSGGSDQVPFFNAGASVVWYHTDGHADYHKPSDHAERINWEKMVDITKAAFLCMWKMANNPF